MAKHREQQKELERAAVTVQAATRSMLVRKNFLHQKNIAIKVQAGVFVTFQKYCSISH